MIEKLQQESAALSLVDHQKKVSTAIELATKDTAPQPMVAAPQAAKQTGVDNNPLVTEVMSNAVFGSIFSAAITIGEDLAAKKNTNSIFVGGGPKKNEGSLFLGGKKAKSVSLVPDGKIKTRRPTPLSVVKPKDGLVEKANIASMSVTGSSTAGGGLKPMMGLVVKPSSVPNVSELKTELALVHKTMANPYEKSKERLRKDLAEGVDRAEEHVMRNPQAAPKLAIA